MGPDFVAAVCEALADQGADLRALEQIRTLLHLDTLRLHPGGLGHATPEPSASTRWRELLTWRGRDVGVLEGEGAIDAATLRTLCSLVASSLVQHDDRAHLEARFHEVERSARRALDLSELVTWLLHARDHEEVEQLGTTALATMLEVEAGGLVTRMANGTWMLTIPARGLVARELGPDATPFQPLVRRECVELELGLSPTEDPLQRVLCDWGFKYAFAVPLDSGQSPQGIVLALSSERRPLEPELRVAGAQLAVMISVALDRLADQRKIAEHRKSLGDALRAASMGTWELDLKTQELKWSRELHQLMGGGFHECVVTREAALEMLDPEDRETHQLNVRTLLAKGQVEPTVMQLTTLDKRRRWMRIIYELQVDHDGTPVRVHAVCRDVTQEVLTERALKQSQERLQQATEMAHIGAWDYDVASGKHTWSDEIRRIYGVPPDFQPDGDVRSFYSRDSASRLSLLQFECLTDGKPYDVELEIIQPGGQRVWARHLCNAERVEGRTVRLFGALQDVTEQHRAREEALTASRVKSQFLANTSHEIRTPLNGILGMTQLALQTKLTDEQREYLEAAHASGQNLLAIVNDILDISKIESGHLQLEAIPFSVGERVFESVRGQASRAHSKGLELVVDLDPALPEQLVGDPVRVGQIITNLVGNAVKFTEHGEVRVSAQSDHGLLHLAVADTGIGIPEDRIESIFEAFTQADGSTNRRFGGTGLGLTITLELAEAMKGRIEVESAPGRGSIFHVYLPLPAAPTGPRIAPTRRRLRTLVVAGNASGETITVRQLRQLGCEVCTSRPEEAVRRLLEALETSPYELLVMDQELDGTTGVELGEALQIDESLSRLPRLLLVRTTGRPSTAQLQEAGIARVLTRPVCASELASTLDELRPGGTFEPAPSAPSLPRVRRSLHVLLAEDNAINARLARGLLEKLGHRVTHVTDGSLAVDATAKERWDVVLMDMQMPVLDGLDATRQIRAAEAQRGGHVPIVALTANAMKGDDLICFEAGMDAYLTKPINLEELTRTLEQLTAELREKSA